MTDISQQPSTAPVVAGGSADRAGLRDETSGTSAAPGTAQGPAQGSAAATPWRIALATLVVSVGVTLALFSETAWSMVATWWGDRTYGHGFLILPVTLYLVWRQRASLARLAPRAHPLGLVLLAAAVSGWLIATAADIQLVQQVALVAMIQSLVLALLGWTVTRRILFPLLFLYFAVPFGNFLIPHLQQVTALLTVDLLRLTGIPVFLDGLFIHIPSGHFVVAEACAGVRFLISTIVLGTLLAYLFFGSWWRRAIIVGLSVAIPIVANGIRAYGIVLLAHLSDFRIAVGADHIIYGWIFFSIVTLSLIAAAFALREHDGETHPSAGPAHPDRPGRRATPSPLIATGVVGVSAMVMVASAAAYATITAHPPERNALADLEPWAVEMPWSPTGAVSSWTPRFRAADDEILQSYSDGEHRVDLYMAAYAYQRQGAEIVNELNRFADEEAWRRIGGGRTVQTFDGETREVGVVSLASRNRKRLVWYWYWVDGRFTARPVTAKILQARARLLGGEPAAAVIAVAAEYEESPAEAAPVLRAFLHSVPSVRTSLETFAGNRVAKATTAADRS